MSWRSKMDWKATFSHLAFPFYNVLSRWIRCVLIACIVAGGSPTFLNIKPLANLLLLQQLLVIANLFFHFPTDLLFQLRTQLGRSEALPVGVNFDKLSTASLAPSIAAWPARLIPIFGPQDQIKTWSQDSYILVIQSSKTFPTSKSPQSRYPHLTRWLRHMSTGCLAT